MKFKLIGENKQVPIYFLLLGNSEVTPNIYCKSRNLANTDSQNYMTGLWLLLGNPVCYLKLRKFNKNGGGRHEDSKWALIMCDRRRNNSTNICLLEGTKCRVILSERNPMVFLRDRDADQHF